MAVTTTALMPLDTAVSPEQASRVLPIRANLLPGELKAGRNARRTRFLLIGAVIIVIGVMTAWYLHARQQYSEADSNLTTANEMVAQAKAKKTKYGEVTELMADQKRVEGELKSLLARDTPWATDLGYIRTDAKAAGVNLAALTGSLGATSTSSAGTPVATVSVTGTAPERKAVASFIEKLASRKQLTQPYATTVSYDDSQRNYTFALTVDLTSDALCGRFTTMCGAGD
jgi:hypothetical protein